MADNKKFRLKVVTPIKTTLDVDVDMVSLQTVDGQIGVLVGHEPVATVLAPGVLRYYIDEKIERLAVFSGFAEINGKEVTVLTDAAEHLDEIDLARAKEAEKRARGRLVEKLADTDVERAKAALERALIRQKLASKE